MGTDIWFDATRKRMYMSAAEGVVPVFDQRDADYYVLTAKIPSVSSSVTSFFVSALNRLFVLPPFGGRLAQVLVYEAQP